MKGNKIASERLNAKTLDQMFVNMVEQGYECPPFVSNAILETSEIGIRAGSEQSEREM